MDNPTLPGGGTIDPGLPILKGNPMVFFNSILRLVFIAAGLYAFFNFIMAGYKFISAGGDAEAVGSAWETIWKSLIGLVIIVLSFVFAALIGWLFFEDPTAILNPQLATPTP